MARRIPKSPPPVTTRVGQGETLSIVILDGDRRAAGLVKVTKLGHADGYTCLVLHSDARWHSLDRDGLVEFLLRLT
jgi:hypothetical protein